jgi:hypothetical protein
MNQVEYKELHDELALYDQKVAYVASLDELPAFFADEAVKANPLVIKNKNGSTKPLPAEFEVAMRLMMTDLLASEKARVQEEIDLM